MGDPHACLLSNVLNRVVEESVCFRVICLIVFPLAVALPFHLSVTILLLRENTTEIRKLFA